MGANIANYIFIISVTGRTFKTHSSLVVSMCHFTGD